MEFMRRLFLLPILFSAPAFAQLPDPAFSDDTVLPGQICEINTFNPGTCPLRQRLVQALVRRDIRQAELIAYGTRATAATRSGSGNMFNAASLGLAIALDLPDVFDFLVLRLDVNRPTYLAAPELAAARQALAPLSDARLGIDFEAPDAVVPPHLLAIALGRTEMIGRLARIRATLDLERTDFRGNNIWHYIAYFGRSDLIAFAPLTHSRLQKNQAGLTPYDLLEANSNIAPAAAERIRAVLLGTPVAAAFTK